MPSEIFQPQCIYEMNELSPGKFLINIVGMLPLFTVVRLPFLFKQSASKCFEHSKSYCFGSHWLLMFILLNQISRVQSFGNLKTVKKLIHSTSQQRFRRNIDKLLHIPYAYVTSISRHLFSIYFIKSTSNVPCLMKVNNIGHFYVM